MNIENAPQKNPIEWYYTKQGTQYGPVNEEELRRLAKTGEITPEDLVWNSAMGAQWQRASSIGDVFATTSAVSPVIPGTTGALGNGTTPNRDLMRMARESLKGRWGLAVGATVIYVAVISLFVGLQISIELPPTIRAQQLQMQAIVAAQQSHQALTSIPPLKIELPLGSKITSYGLQLIIYIIVGPLAVGLCLFFLKIASRSVAKATDIFKGFAIFWRAVGAYFLMLIFVLLWAILLIIPGIIAAYSYSMTFFILADDPTLGPLQAIRLSKAMMKGKRWRLFCLQFRFIGWFLLSLLTCDIGFLWLIPYIKTAEANFYLDVKNRASIS